MVPGRVLIVACVLLLVSRAGKAQHVFRDLRSLEKRGDYYYSRLSYVRAADLYSQALRKRKKRMSYSLNMKAAGLYRKLARYAEAKACFDNILQAGHSLSGQDSMEYFNILRATGDLKADTIFTQRFSRTILNNLFRDTLYYNIYPLPVNTERSAYCPVFLREGLLFVGEEEDSSMVKTVNALNNAGFSNMYYTGKTDTGWTTVQAAGPALEHLLHAGPAAFFDNKKSAVINVCLEGRHKPDRLKLYQAEYDEKERQWKNMLPLPVNSDSYSVGHPAVSEDGTQLFFVSDMAGSLGGTDIYRAVLRDGRWGAPVNLGAKINTPGDEKYPYITSDNILFFSTDGRYGLGGMDIYYIDLNFKDSMVANMGYPVNSSLDDFGFSYDAYHKTGYFSSNRKSGGKDDDLYMYTENKVFLSIEIKDDFDKTNLRDVQVQLWDKDLNVPIRVEQGDALHKVNALLRPAHNYKVILRKENYKNDTLMLSTGAMEDYSNVLSRLVYLKRKPLYYANLKLKDELSNENLPGSLIVVHNRSQHTKDTMSFTGSSIQIKLDGDDTYIITAQNGDKLRYIYVQKKDFTISSTIPHYNLYLGAAKPSILHVRVKKCGEETTPSHLPVKVNDWVNGNEFTVEPGPEGDFKLVVTDYRLFDLFVDAIEIPYSDKEIVREGYCVRFDKE